MELTALFLSRLQFAFTISFHIIFPSFSIGVAAWLTVLEALHLATGRPVYRLIFAFWLKIFGVVFGLGVVSGIVMAFEFGTNWSELSRTTGSIQGVLLSYETFTAFALEASFFGILLFGGYLIGSPAGNKAPLPPKAEYQWWYQYYFTTERGALGYDKYRRDFARLIWQIASPKWQFDDVTFDRTAASFDNLDYVAIVIHNYRWRLGLAEGETKYDDLEKRLAAAPVITVPTITLEGNANGAPHPEPAS